jgi:hypothetical protein
MGGKPGLGGAPQPPPLLRRDHLERMAERVAALALDLAEDEPAPAPDDQVELVPAGPDVRAENPVPAQAVVERGTALEATPGPRGAQAAVAGS